MVGTRLGGSEDMTKYGEDRNGLQFGQTKKH